MIRICPLATFLSLLATLPALPGQAHEAVGHYDGPLPAQPSVAVPAPAVSLDDPIPTDVIARLGGEPKAIYVSKSHRTLTLLSYGQRVKTFPVAIGKIADGPKQRLGDGRTPEGLYYVAAHNAGSRFHKALKISYPNPDDAQRGLRQGLISPGQARAIKQAHATRRLPPQDTRLGRYIEIHGGYRLAVTEPGERPWIYAFTDGCIAVTDDMIEEIYRWTPGGVPVLIQA